MAHLSPPLTIQIKRRKESVPEKLPENGGSLPPPLDESVPVELGHHVGLHHVHRAEIGITMHIRRTIFFI